MSPALQEIVNVCEKIRDDCNLFLQKAELLQKEWLTTGEFAQLAGVKQKTICTYAGQGRYSRIRERNGHYEIHKSELMGGK